MLRRNWDYLTGANKKKVELPKETMFTQDSLLNIGREPKIAEEQSEVQCVFNTAVNVDIPGEIQS